MNPSLNAFRPGRLLVAASLTASLLSLSVQAATLTRDNGAPVGDNQNSQTAGPNGSVLLQDVQLLQKLQRFDRERIPERVVHARGTGAHGEFVASADISDLSMAKVFRKGEKTPVFVRFSAVVHGNHSPETLRDPRGFATKFYTADGNWDLVGNNFPTFFIRDAIKFPDMVHAFKPDPRSNLDDDSRRFDFFSHVPEATRTLTLLYSNEGTPASYREMDGNSVHAYKLVNARGEVHYVKFHWKSLQGQKNLDPKQVAEVQGRDYSHMTNDLVSAIRKGDFPKWDLYIQVLKPEDLAKFDFDPLDATKIWPGIPERKIGQMVLNRNVDNFFQETEQVAMAPSNLVPGIEPSEDRLLQGRLFAYADTQMYRVGANGLGLPVNRPRSEVNTVNQDGALNAGHSTSGVNYQPSRLDPREEQASARYVRTPLSGTTQQAKIQREQNFKQTGELFRSSPGLIATGAAIQAALPLSVWREMTTMRGWILAGLLLAALAAQAGEVHGVEVEARLRDYFFDAARRGDQAMLKEFVEAGFDLDVQDAKGYTALILAAYHGHGGAVEQLLEAGADPCVQDARGNTALMGAIFKGEVRIARRLIGAQCSPDQRNGVGQTAAMYAALFKREELLQALSARGADLGARDALGNSVESLRRGELNGTAAAK